MKNLNRYCLQQNKNSKDLETNLTKKKGQHFSEENNKNILERK